MPNLGTQFSEQGYRSPNLGQAGVGNISSASFEVAMRDLAFTSMYQWWNRRDADEVDPGNRVSRADAEEMIASHGMDPRNFKLDDENIRGDVETNIWLNRRMALLNGYIDQATGESWTATAASLGSSLGAELLDPVNYLAAYVAPVRMAGAGSSLKARFLARAKQSSFEAVAVGVMGQPFMADARQRRGEEYNEFTFLSEVGFDALIGTGLSGSMGLFSDLAHIASGRTLPGDPVIAEGQAMIQERTSQRYAEKEHDDIMRQAVYFDYHNRVDAIDELMAPQYLKEKSESLARIDNAEQNGILSPDEAQNAIARINGERSPVSIRIGVGGKVEIDVRNKPANEFDMEGMPNGVRTRVEKGMAVEDAIKEYGEEVAGLEMRAASDIRRILGEETPDSLSEWISREGGMAVEDIDGITKPTADRIEHPSFKVGGKSLQELRVEAKKRGYIPQTATDKEFVQAVLKDITKGNVYARSDLAKFGDWVNAALDVINETDLKERQKIRDMEDAMSADLAGYFKEMSARVDGTKYNVLIDPEHVEIIEKSKDIPDLETELGKQPDMQESIRRDFGEDSDIVQQMEAEMDKASRTQRDFLKASEEIMSCQLGIAPQ